MDQLLTIFMVDSEHTSKNDSIVKASSLQLDCMRNQDFGSYANIMSHL